MMVMPKVTMKVEYGLSPEVGQFGILCHQTLEEKGDRMGHWERMHPELDQRCP
jgi:hypothetical protein